MDYVPGSYVASTPLTTHLTDSVNPMPECGVRGERERAWSWHAASDRQPCPCSCRGEDSLMASLGASAVGRPSSRHERAAETTARSEARRARHGHPVRRHLPLRQPSPPPVEALRTREALRSRMMPLRHGQGWAASAASGGVAASWHERVPELGPAQPAATPSGLESALHAQHSVEAALARAQDATCHTAAASGARRAQHRRAQHRRAQHRSSRPA